MGGFAAKKREIVIACQWVVGFAGSRNSKRRIRLGSAVHRELERECTRTA